MNTLQKVVKFLSETEVILDEMYMDLERGQSVLIVVKTKFEKDEPQGFYLGEVSFDGCEYVCLIVNNTMRRNSPHEFD